MTDIRTPAIRPRNPEFSSGPCKKIPTWKPQKLDNAVISRSHRSVLGKLRIKEAIDKTARLLCLPKGYRVGIVPASDTGALEMALWSLLGVRAVDVLVWESFGKGWANDIKNELKLSNLNIYESAYGELPDLTKVNFSNDVVFTWNGTTSGVKVPDGDWIASDRQGLSICDATSAVFAQALPWDKLDVTTFSWQKVLGGEAAHGVIILSARAVERLESHTPSWPLPKIFRLTKAGKLIEGIFKGATINTPSMLCIEDYIVALNWIDEIGGLSASIDRADNNAKIIYDWVEDTPWIATLPTSKEISSNTSVCLRIIDSEIMELAFDKQLSFIKSMTMLLEKEGVAYDIGSYRDAPPGIRIWAGSTIDQADIRALLPWLEWAYHQARSLIGLS